MEPATNEIFQITKDLVVFGIALLGAGLGVLNYWRSIDKDKVKLKVTPSRYVANRQNGLCIEVINLGFVPVTIKAISLEFGREREWYYFGTAKYSTGTPLPHRLQPRESITALLPPDAHQQIDMKRLRCAFAKTACGLVFRGTSPVFKGWRKEHQLDGKQSQIATS